MFIYTAAYVATAPAHVLTRKNKITLGEKGLRKDHDERSNPYRCKIALKGTKIIYFICLRVR